MVRRRQRRGFTMLEVVATFVLLGILAALATSGLSRAIARSDDAAAAASLDRVLLSQRTFANAFGEYASLPTDLRDLGRDVVVLADPTPSTGSTEISIAVGEDGTLGVAVQSKTGTCIVRKVTPLSAGSEASVVPADGGGLCNGSRALPEGAPIRAATSLRP